MESRRLRLPPFLIAAAVILIVSLAIFRLPESFVVRLENESPFSPSQAGWAYRLLALAAIAQAAYGGFAVLHIDRIRKARAADPKAAEMSNQDTIRTVARNAAGMVVLTLVYGGASFYVTGQRGGYWLFALLAVAQGAWYYRQVGQVAKWLVQQPEPVPRKDQAAAWQPEPPDYSPPLGR